MKLIFLQLLLLVSVISCSKDHNVEPEKLFMKLIPNQGYVKINDSISISLYIENNENFQLEYEWTSDKGTIYGQENNSLFIAPAIKDDVTINLKLTDQYGNIYKDSVIIKVYKQFVILKADDLINDYGSIFPYRWIKFIDYIEDKGIKASIGIIGNSLESGSQSYFNLIKEHHYKGNIEFWNHGYDHLINGINAKGEKYHEHKNSPLEFQKAQIQKSQNLSKAKLGFYFRAFGAPGNAIDNNTLQAIENDTTILVWFYGEPASTRLNLARHPKCEIEYPVHHPNYHEFIQNYDPESEILVLQLHPNSWDTSRFMEFYQVMDYLIDQGVTFMNPLEYYNLINNVADEIIF